jgi:hypothetical protein
MVVDEWQPVPTAFEPLPQCHLLIGCELIKPTGFNLLDHIIESGVEGVEGHIEWAALVALSCVVVPEFHTSILFESVFDGKRFLNKIRKIDGQERALNRPTPTRTPPPHSAGMSCSCTPDLLPAAAVAYRPELGSRLAVGHPQGLALTPARTTPHSHSREQVVIKLAGSRS